MNTHIGDKLAYFSTHRVVWQSFAKIGTGTSKIWWMEKIKKITRPKNNSLPLSRATVTRQLAINVSIPNLTLTVVRLEQFRPPQLRIQ